MRRLVRLIARGFSALLVYLPFLLALAGFLYAALISDRELSLLVFAAGAVMMFLGIWIVRRVYDAHVSAEHLSTLLTKGSPEVFSSGELTRVRFIEKRGEHVLFYTVPESADENIGLYRMPIQAFERDGDWVEEGSEVDIQIQTYDGFRRIEHVPGRDVRRDQ